MRLSSGCHTLGETEGDVKRGELLIKNTEILVSHLGSQHANRRKHRDAAVLELRLAILLKRLVGDRAGEAERVEKTHRGKHTFGYGWDVRVREGHNMVAHRGERVERACEGQNMAHWGEYGWDVRVRGTTFFR